MEENRNTPRKIRWDHLLVWALVLIVTASAVGILLRLLPKDEEGVTSLIDETINIEFQTEPQSEWVNVVPKPEIDIQHLTVNEFSRPGTKTGEIEYIVIHYLGNPGTTAQENHDYFESLKDNIDDVSMSANFVIGIEGEIIECVPPGEIAYASNQLNGNSISVENCHLEETGRFTVETYESCVKLTAWLVAEYELDREDIIRHYDVTGKQCPLYYVQNPDKWEAFRDDVMAYIEECTDAYMKAVKESEEAAKKEQETESEKQTKAESEARISTESLSEDETEALQTEQKAEVKTEAAAAEATEAVPEQEVKEQEVDEPKMNEQAETLPETVPSESQSMGEELQQ